MTPRSFSGGCACGALRYTITGEPAAMLDCQCRQCQRSSGTGHQSHISFAGAEVRLDGPVAHWDCTGDGGTLKRRGFCPSCGAPVYLTFPAAPEVFVVTPASLDDPSIFAPQFITWAAAGPAWDRVDPALPRFERMPG